MKWRDWYEENEDTSVYADGGWKTISWKTMTKKQKKEWKERNPKPFRSNMTREEVLRLNAFVSKATDDVFAIECRQTGIGSVWIVRDIDTDEEYDFTDMSTW